ncbi:MAG: hypothetical protein U0271_34980 [Polyangiaceae bacterium]
MILLTAGLSGEGCSAKAERQDWRSVESVPVSSARASAPPSSSDGGAASAPAAAADSGSARIEINGSRVALDAKPIAELPNQQRLEKIDGLFTALKLKLESARLQDPNRAFKGVARLEITPDTPMIVVKCVYQTVAFAGYSFISLQVVGRPGPALEIGDPIGAPPPAQAPSANDPASSPKVLFVSVNDGEVVLEWKKQTESTEERHVPASGDLEREVCEGWRRHGSHQRQGDPRLDNAVLRIANDKTMATLVPVLEALDSCKRLSATGKEERAFAVTFSIR